jgi:hypothetical protein
MNACLRAKKLTALNMVSCGSVKTIRRRKLIVGNMHRASTASPSIFLLSFVPVHVRILIFKYLRFPVAHLVLNDPKPFCIDSPTLIEMSICKDEYIASSTPGVRVFRGNLPRGGKTILYTSKKCYYPFSKMGRLGRKSFPTKMASKVKSSMTCSRL